MRLGANMEKKGQKRDRINSNTFHSYTAVYNATILIERRLK